MDSKAQVGGADAHADAAGLVALGSRTDGPMVRAPRAPAVSSQIWKDERTSAVAARALRAPLGLLASSAAGGSSVSGSRHQDGVVALNGPHAKR
jgi:hypothetical protein